MTSGLEAFPVPEKAAGEIFRVKGKQFSSVPNNHNRLKCMQLTLQLFQKYFYSSVPQDSLHMLHCETWRRQCCVLAHPFPFSSSTEKLHFRQCFSLPQRSMYCCWCRRPVSGDLLEAPRHLRALNTNTNGWWKIAFAVIAIESMEPDMLLRY